MRSAARARKRAISANTQRICYTSSQRYRADRTPRRWTARGLPRDESGSV